jgi:hypothetical protein
VELIDKTTKRGIGAQCARRRLGDGLVALGPRRALGDDDDLVAEPDDPRCAVGDGMEFAKPLSKSWSVGFMGTYELSQAALVPDYGAPPITFHTAYLPSGGLGLHWHPDEHWQAGVRGILSHDNETRTQASTSKTGFLRSYEYRLGAAYSPWAGALFDVGAAALDRSNGLEGTSTFDVHPTVGAEQALVKKRVWARAGLDETTWTTGMSVALKPIKIDLAYLYNLAAARTGDVFGKRNTSLIATINLDYEAILAKAKGAGG